MREGLVVYEVVGKRKEYYEKCEGELEDRLNRINEFAKEQFGIEAGENREITLATDLNGTVLYLKGNHEKLREVHERLKERKDVIVKEKTDWKGKIYELVIKPNARTKEGKRLKEKWEKVVFGDFGVLELSEPFFLKLSWLNRGKEEKELIKGNVYAKVKRQGDRLFLVDWSGFDPEKLDGFERVELIEKNGLESQGKRTLPKP